MFGLRPVFQICFGHWRLHLVKCFDDTLGLAEFPQLFRGIGLFNQPQLNSMASFVRFQPLDNRFRVDVGTFKSRNPDRVVFHARAVWRRKVVHDLSSFWIFWRFVFAAQNLRFLLRRVKIVNNLATFRVFFTSAVVTGSGFSSFTKFEKLGDKRLIFHFQRNLVILFLKLVIILMRIPLFAKRIWSLRCSTTVAIQILYSWRFEQNLNEIGHFFLI